MIVGIVLAAGRSRRMGETKALLRRDGGTFVGAAIGAMADAGCAPVRVVYAESQRSVAEAARAVGGEPIPNPDPSSEQVESLRIALRGLPDGVRAAVISPVDVPFASATVRALVDRFADGSPAVVIPTIGGAHGHPVLLRADLFDELSAPDLPEGARSVIDRHSHDVAEVAVEDSGAAIDIDTPADYAEYLAHTRDAG